jgi:hypothetical protein
MPTGYTADVCDGKVSDFKTFALRCARNFVALIMMRDDPIDAPIPEEFKPCDYNEKALQKAKADLSRIDGMTGEECNAAEMESRSEMLGRHKAHLEECKEKWKRLTAMLSMVAEWVPPTSEHVGLKEFMLEQLDMTIRQDAKPETCYLDKASIRTGEEWRRDQVAELKRSIKYHTEEAAKEVERTASRNRWVADLRRSLEQVIS